MRMTRYILLLFIVGVAIAKAEENLSTTTVDPVDPLDEHADVNILKKAIDDKDVRAIMNVLTTREIAKCLKIAEAYNTTYGVDLIENLQSTLTEDLYNLTVALMTQLPDYWIKELHDAISRDPIDVEAIIELVCGNLSNQFIHMITYIYDSNVPSHKRFRRVTNGTEARPGEFPYMAEVGRLNDEDHIGEIYWVCGGTLISWWYVLTAAHCISGGPTYAYDFVVRVGSVDIRHPQFDTQEIRAPYTKRHPRYAYGPGNDIGLLLLERSVYPSPNVKPLNLRTSYDLQNIDVDAETSYVAIGFGQTSYYDNKSEKLLKTENMTLIPGKTCWENHYKDSPTGIAGMTSPDDIVICAIDADETRRSDTCLGDSGGPLVMLNGRNTFLLGITASGKHCGTIVPGVYVYVLPYLDWIETEALIEVYHRTDEANSVARFRNWLENLISRESSRIDPRSAAL